MVAEYEGKRRIGQQNIFENIIAKYFPTFLQGFKKVNESYELET